MLFTLALLLSFYAVAVFYVAKQWKEEKELIVAPTLLLPKVSVIIPFRNEEETLPKLIKELLQQDYDKALFEIIVINDHSTDNSLEQLKPFQDKINILINPSEGKKQALNTGIDEANGEYIFTIDADCSVGAKWLSTSVKNIIAEDAVLQTGPVFLKETKGFLTQFQAMEWLALMAITQLQFERKNASMANGANLLFKKEVFYEVNGYQGNENIPSGDDQFLLQKIKKKYPKQICFAHHQDCIVRTEAQETFSEMLHQKVRWAGKWKANKGLDLIAAPLLFLFHVLFLIALYFSFQKEWVPIGVILVTLSHAYLFYRTASFFNFKLSILSFIIANFTYSFYAIAVGVLTLSRRSYIWKGRKIHV